MTTFVPTLKGDAAERWEPEPNPDISGVEFWADAPWRRPLEGTVDRAATEALATIPGKRNVRLGGSVPWQFADEEVSVANYKTDWYGARTDRGPMPEHVRRVGDPTDGNKDRQAFVIDLERGVYVEYSNLRPISPQLMVGLNAAAALLKAFRRPVPFDPKAKLQAGAVSVFDLDGSWKSGMGTAAIKSPMVPQTPTFEELRDGRVEKQLQFVATAYQPGKLLGYARGSDGEVASSPLIAGMMLRLTERRHAQLVELWANEPHAVALLNCLREFGCVVADKTDPDAGHGIRMPQDPRVHLGGLTLSILDFEIVV